MEDLILAILVGLALAAVRLRDLLGATAVLGAYSLMMALLWAAMNALDVSFTEAAVGAGISTVLFMAAIARTARRERPARVAPSVATGRRHPGAARLAALLVCGFVMAALFFGMRDMPVVGAHDAPALLHPEVAQRYLHRSPNRSDGTLGEVGSANIVTSVLGDYRGYDTMGETVVIFTAALSVVLLLRPARKRREP